MIQRRKFRTEKARKRDRIRLAGKVFGMVTGAVLCVVLFTYFLHGQKLRLEQITIETSGVLEKDLLANAIKAQVSGNFFGAVPQDTVFRISYRGVGDSLNEQFPRIKDVHFERAGVYDLHAIVSERTPAALWCGDVVPPIAYVKVSDMEDSTDTIWGTCYLMDEGGYIYARAPLYSGAVMPRYYGSLEKAEPIAQQYIAEEDFKEWQYFNQVLTENNVSAQAVLFVDEHDVEVYLINGLKVLIPRQNDVEVTLHRLFALLDSGSLDVDKEVEYVDLRFGSKAFVKYFGENVEG